MNNYGAAYGCEFQNCLYKVLFKFIATGDTTVIHYSLLLFSLLRLLV